LGASDRNGAKVGAAMAVLAFLMWGLLAIYWKALPDVSPEEVLAHRIVWSLAFMAVLLIARKRWGEIFRALRSARDVGRLALCSLLLGANWYTFIWAIAHDRVLECSLGYYINPLVSVALGRVFLRERLRRWQALALVLACAAVANLLVSHGQVPWAGLVLAGTFAVYGLLRKTAKMDSVPGLTAETALLAVPAGAFLLWLDHAGRLAFFHVGRQTDVLLVGAGIVTALPLLLFSYAARRIRLATVGFIQYLAPSCMFLLGAFVYDEPLDLRRLATFMLIWAALAIYSWDNIVGRPSVRNSAKAQVPAEPGTG